MVDTSSTEPNPPKPSVDGEHKRFAEWELPNELLHKGKEVVSNAFGPEGTRAVSEIREIAQRFIMQHIARVLDGVRDDEKRKGEESSNQRPEGETDEEDEELFLFDVHAEEVKEVLIETVGRMMLDSQVGELFVQTLAESQEEGVGRVLAAQRIKHMNDRNICYRSCPSFVPKRTVAREVAEEEMIRMLQSVAEGMQSSEFSRAISALVKAELEQSESGRTLRRLASRMKQNGMGRLLLNIISRQVIQSKAGQALTWALIMQEISKSQMLSDSNVAITMSREGAKSSMKLATAAVLDSFVEFTTSSPNIAAYLSWARLLLIVSLVIVLVSDLSAVVVAVNYWNNRCDHPLAWYWLVMGLVGVMTFALHPVLRLLSWTYGARAGEIFSRISVADLSSGLTYLLAVKSDWFTRFGIAIAFAMRGGYVLGSIWVYAMSPNTNAHACNVTLFFYSWWFLTIVWVLHSLAFFVLVGISCWSYRARQRLEEGYLPGQ